MNETKITEQSQLTPQTPAHQGQSAPQKTRIETLEESFLALATVVEELAKKVDEIITHVNNLSLGKGTPALTKSDKPKAKFGGQTGRKSVLDKKTNIVYASLGAAGKALATEFGFTTEQAASDQFIWYKFGPRNSERLVVLDEKDPIAIEAQKKADEKMAAENQAYVDEANKKFAEEKKAQEASMGKGNDGAAKAGSESATKANDKQQGKPSQNTGKKGNR